MLPIMAGLAAASAIGTIGKGIAAANDPLAKANKQRMEELERLKSKGMGYTDQEKSLMKREALAPVQAGVGELGREYARAGVASGSSDGGTMERLRKDQLGALGNAAEQTGAGIARADLDKRDQNANELAGLKAGQAQRRNENITGIMGELANAAGTAGMIAGDVPELTRAAGVFSGPVKDWESFGNSLRGKGLPEDDVAAIIDVARRYDGSIARALREGTPEEKRILTSARNALEPR